MPPKCKITKEAIINTAIKLIREKGFASLNARAVAAELKCSTQPIFSNYTSMKALIEDVAEHAYGIYEGYLSREMASGEYPTYKSTGIAYIRFAKEERELFKLLFMRENPEPSKEADDSVNKIIGIVSENLGVSEEDARKFHLEMWIFVHGIASMIATSYISWEISDVSDALTDIYEGMKMRLKEKYQCTESKPKS